MSTIATDILKFLLLELMEILSYSYLFSSVIAKLLKSSQIVLRFVLSSTYTLSLGPASSTLSAELSCFLPVSLRGNQARAVVYNHIYNLLYVYTDFSTVLEVS